MSDRSLPGLPRLAAGALLALAVFGAAGCRIGGDGKSFKNENDELRSENLKLAREIGAFEVRVRLLDAELSTLRKDRQGDAPLADAIPPVLSALKFARYTGPIDTDGDGRDDRVVMYIQPVDQLDRMRVTAGRLNVQAVSLRAEKPPRVVADRTYEPREFDDRWRTGLTGDHYSIDLDLPADLSADVQSVTVQLTLTEAGTGVVVEAQESFRAAAVRQLAGWCGRACGSP